jgi:hypothetical protein
VEINEKINFEYRTFTRRETKENAEINKRGEIK